MSGEDRVNLGTCVLVMSRVHPDDAGGAFFTNEWELLDAQLSVVAKSPTLVEMLSAETVRRILSDGSADRYPSGLRRTRTRNDDYIIIDDPILDWKE